MSKVWWWVVLLLVASVAATTWLLGYGGIELLINRFWLSHAFIEENKALSLLVFFAISFFSQLIVMPSGSLMLLIAGFTLGALPSAGVFAVAQVLSAWPVYRLSNTALDSIDIKISGGRKAPKVERLKERLKQLKGNDLVATALLRLTPVIPSAGASVLAALSGVRIVPFMLGTVLTCWVRPLFFASNGAALSEVLLRRDGSDVLGEVNMWPLALVFISACALYLGARVLSRFRHFEPTGHDEHR
jgi:uncharacterized membrane protein YdjX (TVP38/TMEM64 family)